MANPNRYLDEVIPKLYRRQTMDYLMFGFVKGMINTMPSITINEAVESFMKVFNISEDLLELKSLVTTYHRVNTDLINAKKTNHKSTT